MKPNYALTYLQEKEWTVGNGQCPECYGVPESWYGHPCHLNAETIGHKHGCKAGESIRQLGGRTIFQGEFEPSENKFQEVEDEKKRIKEYWKPIEDSIRAELREAIEKLTSQN